MIEAVVVTEDQWPLWRELRLEALAEAPGAFTSTLAEWSGPGDTEERWRSRLREVELNLVLLYEAVPAGMVSASAPGPDHPAELRSMWVSPPFRGLGVGDRAVHEVVRWTRQNFPAAELWLCVKRGNDPAHRLYRRHGFVACDAAAGAMDQRMRLSPTR